MNTARLCAVGVIAAISAGASAGEPPKADLYVAVDGNDNNPGTAEAPLASIARARDLLRPRLAAGMNSDVLVLIRGGTYRLPQPLVFGPEDSGTDRHTITYAAWPGEKVVLSGGQENQRLAAWAGPALDRGTSRGQSRPVVLPPVVCRRPAGRPGTNAESGRVVEVAAPTQ